jgi:cell wall-associated NlpC family hydrolase
VAEARRAATEAATALAVARAAQAGAQKRLDALESQVEALVERWNAARADADAARAVSDLAAAHAIDATAAAAGAQRDVDRLAAQSYQLGADMSGGLGEWASVLDSAFSSGGISALTDRVADLGHVAADRRHRADSAADLSLAALQAQMAAERASADLALREQQASDAAAAIAAQRAAQQAEVVRLTAVRDSAARTLAKARTAASVLAEQRAEALRREAAARAAAAARARAEAERRARGGGHPPNDGGTSGWWPGGQSITSSAQRQAALAWARTQFGKPYVAGSDGPDSYDCSGLTSAAYRTVGISLVQFSQAQFAAGAKIPVSSLQPGDLVYFATNPSDWRTIHHVGIYAGGGQMVEAPHTGDVVKYMTIWQDSLVPYGSRP